MTQAEGTGGNDKPLSTPPMTLSLTEGGPADALFRRLKLVYSGRRADAIRIAVILALATWLPLVVLCFSEGLVFDASPVRSHDL